MPRQLGRTVVLPNEGTYRVHHLSERLAHVEAILAAGERLDLSGRPSRLTTAQRDAYEHERDNLMRRLEAND